MEPTAIPGREPGVELLGLLRPYVRQCGDERRGAWRLGGRRLLDHLVVYIAEGRGRFRIAGVEHAASPGALFWIPPDTDHEMEGFAPGMTCPYVHLDLAYRDPASHWDFVVPPGMRDLSGLEALRDPPLNHPLLAGLAGAIPGPGTERVGKLIRRICQEAHRAQPFTALRLSGLALELIAEVLALRRGGGDPHCAGLEAAAQTLAQELRAPVTQAAAVAGLGASRFRDLFRRQFGIDPRTFQKRARIQKAKELMVAGDLRLHEIARRCGFATAQALAKAFRAEEGLTPSDYRTCRPARIAVEGRMMTYRR